MLRSLLSQKPVERSEDFLAPCTWQGWLITAVAGALAFGTAKLALYLYPIKPDYGLMAWAGFAVIILLFMHVANTFSNHP